MIEISKFLKYLVLLICLVGSMLLVGCLSDFFPYVFQEKEEPRTVIPEEPEQGPADSEEEKPPEGVLYLKVYFLEGKGNYLIPVTAAIPWTDGVARAALQRLIEGPTPSQEMRYGLSSIMSPTTEIRGLTIRDGLAKVDFSVSFLSYDPGLERQVLNSVVFTLLQFPTVKDVQILVEGFAPELFPGGTPGKGTFSRERGLNLEVAEGVTDFENTQPLTLYFCTVLGENDIFYVPVTRVISSDDDIIKASINELLKGPRPNSHLFSELPPGTALRNYSFQDGMLVLDLTNDLLNYKGGLSGEKNILAQLMLTLTEIPDVEKVQLLIEGRMIELTYGTSLLKPISRPLVINRLL
ncbi:MAG: GerMN domain-containing protein [Bacillota bacterium]|nr:GerMN domain-containing protein [Bacillota bacterium]